MMADRRHHLRTMIEPALAAGTHVLCDRYTDASRAYQGAGRGLGEKKVDELHARWCRRDPDRTYLFDLPVEAALARVAKRRGASYDRFEEEDEDFHRKGEGGLPPARPEGAEAIRRHRRVALRGLPSFFHSKKIFVLLFKLPEARVSGAPVVLLAGPGSAPPRGRGARRGRRRHLRERLRPRVAVRAPRLPDASTPTSWWPRPSGAGA